MKSLKSQDGFVVIVALGMMLMLSVFGIILQSMTIQMMQSMKNSENLLHARLAADSTLEYLQYVLKDGGAGYSLNEDIVCNYGSYATSEDTGFQANGNSTFCDKLKKKPTAEVKEDDMKITATIKGRNDKSEKFAQCGGYLGADGCYVVPAPGTGTAGKNCDFYTPVAGSSALALIGANGKQTSSAAKNSSQDYLAAQIDYSCNWNKLQFGSSMIDRVAIPFYYTIGEESNELGMGEPKIVSPFNSDPTQNGNNPGKNFAVRLRTPCKPKDVSSNVGGVTTTKTEIPTDCDDDDRYELNSVDGDDIVVQWQITGECDDDKDGTWEACGMVPYSEYKPGKEGKEVEDYFSGINEGRLNYKYASDTYLYNIAQGTDDSKHRVVYPKLLGIDTSGYMQTWIFEKAKGYAQSPEKLPTMRAPVLSLFLSNKLIDVEGKYVPYLEYQVLTDQPIGDSRIQMEVTAVVNGSVVKKTLYKEEQKSLIDFAIQN